jgi:hypothetical protein
MGGDYHPDVRDACHGNEKDTPCVTLEINAPERDAHNKEEFCTEKQDRQCTYNVTLRRVHETIVVVEKQEILHIGLCVPA